MDEFNQEGSNFPAPIQLISDQELVLRILRDVEKENKSEGRKLGDWYFGAICVLADKRNPDRFSQAANSLREILEKLFKMTPAAAKSPPPESSFHEMRKTISEKLDQDEIYGGKPLEGRKITSSLAKALEKIRKYLDKNLQPTRRESMRSWFAANLFPKPDQETLEKICRGFSELWGKLQDYTHHNINHHVTTNSAEDFQSLLNLFEHVIMLTMVPTIARSHHEINEILEKDQSPSEEDVQKIQDLINQEPANFDFFFREVVDSKWLKPLRNCFKRPPGAMSVGGGYVTLPGWEPVHYLSKIVGDVPEEVSAIIREMEGTDNSRVLEEIVEIALKIKDVNLSLLLEEKIHNYLDSMAFLQYLNVPKLLPKWAKGGDEGLAAALRVARPLIAFHMPDREDIEPCFIWPSPKFSDYEYEEILNKGIRPLADIAPLETAIALIEAVAYMLQLWHPEEGQSEDQWEDPSTIWCPLIGEPSEDYISPQEGLVHALTYACEQVYKRQFDAISDLDKNLCEKRWAIFNRIRCHLYANHLLEQTKPGICECIQAYKHYDKYEYYDELRQLIQSACERFKENLLTKGEREKIFSSILQGPDESDFRRRQSYWGESFSAEAFTEHQRYFHLAQLKPFENVLFGEYKGYYLKLLQEMGDQLADEDESSRRESGERVQSVSHQSPKSIKQLTDMSDEDLIMFLNEWENTQSKVGEPLVDFIGLKYAFQQVIDAQPQRFANWGKRWKKIRRPIYLTCVMSVASKLVKDGSVEHISAWFDVCDLILSYPDHPSNTKEGYSNVSAERPCWRSARSAILDFMDVCLDDASNVSATWRSRICDILTKLCKGYDWRLDENRPILVNLDDPSTEAGNTTRGHALESLIRYGYWVRKHEGKSEALPEIFEILDARFAGEPTLTTPEYALLGGNLVNIYGLDEVWVQKKLRQIFPYSKPACWQAAFRTYLRYNRCRGEIFNLVRSEFEYALNNIDTLRVSEESHPSSISILGERIFTYYCWGKFPLHGDDSLLEKYYQASDTKAWANLFGHVGRRLKNSGQPIDSDIHKKFLDFFESRLKVECQEELQEFTSWLEAECLPAKWRLEQYSRILDKVEMRETKVWAQSTKLGELLGIESDLVVKCFVKLVKQASKENNYITTEAAQAILGYGMDSEDLQTQNVSRKALNELLRLGRFDLKGIGKSGDSD